MNNGQFFILIVSEDETFIQDCGNLFGIMHLNDNQVGLASPQSAVQDAANKEVELAIFDIESKKFSVAAAEALKKSHPKTKMLFAGLPENPALIGDLVKAGFHSFSKKPLERAHIEPFVAGPASTSQNQNVSSKTTDAENQVIISFSPKGGSGVTLITVALATQLAKTYPNEVVVMSLAPQCGDPCAYLDVESKYTLWDLLSNHKNLDESYVQGVIQKHKSGVHILSGPNFDQSTPTIDHLRDIQSIVTLLKQRYKYVFVDGGNAENYLLQNLMSQSNQICLIGNVDFPSLKGLVNAYNRMMRFGLYSDRVHVVINRYNAKNNMNLGKFEESIDHPIACRLPNNYPLCSEAVNTGRSLIEIDEAADISTCIRQLADVITGDKSSKTEQRTRKDDSLATKMAKMILGHKS